MAEVRDHFESLVKSHKDAVYRQLVRMCGNHEDAEDVLAEALMNAYRSIEQLREADHFRAWLAQIGRRACGRLKRREAMTPILSLVGDVAVADSMEQAVLERETKSCLMRAMAALPDRYREVYELRDVEGLSGPETARRLGISLANVKSRLHRARAQLREEIDAALMGEV